MIYFATEDGYFTGDDGSGPYARDSRGYYHLMASRGDSAFYEGQEFRSFDEFSVAPGATLVYRYTAGVNTRISSFEFDLEVASLRVEIKAGGTPGGTFGVSIPAIPLNTMTTTPAYIGVNTIVKGGTHTGGTLRNLFNINANAQGQASNTQAVLEESPVGLGPGEFYITLQNTNGITATGIVRWRWQERPLVA